LLGCPRSELIKAGAAVERLNYLEYLESESISLIREVAEEFENPAILFSGGKDSLLLIHLAIRAFWPAKIPFKIVHVDTGHNFPETLQFRDWLVNHFSFDLIVGSVEDSIRRGTAAEEKGPDATRNRIQSVTLLETIEKYRFDALIGGARRDEEKARAKERFFSHRNEFGEWDPKNQRPELWSIFNCKKSVGENFRVFPLNNWTEMDVWNYIQYRDIKVPSLYFSHKREVFTRHGILYAVTPFKSPMSGEKSYEAEVRFRTIGDATCTGALLSSASTVEEVIAEVAKLKTTERGTRADDKVSETAMEDRKKQGYF
jgi:sulfate adenylyltransferase subunit 2